MAHRVPNHPMSRNGGNCWDYRDSAAAGLRAKVARGPASLPQWQVGRVWCVRAGRGLFIGVAVAAPKVAEAAVQKVGVSRCRHPRPRGHVQFMGRAGTLVAAGTIYK